ncbi:putative fatty acyl-CoA reductase CG5065 [Ischnura elegans]|uniref:putative fatty acyl-CoA reductase CG5065 n=1 Tax=Ischnura elegans TaxID=197161 RepID=UPI001ED881F5|nr:putative fatty acyl-CoA reductase CG5065 [Ischnura elegans]XP_046382881.1 putative fatty acyl-CoA reductase CG5065 [Ischnura elegans]
MDPPENVADGSSQTIPEFFSGRSVFITGATGFVGKALVEKLLRSCPEIATVYVLIRTKRGLDAAARHAEFLKNPVFERVRSECPQALSKIVSIAGDVGEAGLGLSPSDRQRLCSQVSVVFHSAATVRFNEGLRNAATLNTLGTQRLVQLCKEIENLQALVHVSTAYSNATRRYVGEEVYPPPADPQKMLQCVQGIKDDVLNTLTPRFISGHPNTYTFTKALAESIVNEEAQGLPAAIVRPSIVTAAWKEPFPGWVDNVCGITGIMMEIGRGTIRSIICDDRLIVDLIPVDVVVNTLITVAWYTATQRPKNNNVGLEGDSSTGPINPASTVCVYNCTSSGSGKPIHWDHYGRLTLKHVKNSPTRYVQWYPGFTFRTNRVVHVICEYLLHLLPAYLVDMVLRVQGAKPIMVKICRRFQMAAKTGEFFSLHEWDFEGKGMQGVHHRLAIEDAKTFPIDISGFDWNEYVRTYVLGIRRFVLKDPPETIPKSCKKLNRLYWLHRVVQLLTVFLILRSIIFR